jgi:hypothetical protein
VAQGLQAHLGADRDRKLGAPFDRPYGGALLGRVVGISGVCPDFGDETRDYGLHGIVDARGTQVSGGGAALSQ